MRLRARYRLLIMRGASHDDAVRTIAEEAGLPPYIAGPGTTSDGRDIAPKPWPSVNAIAHALFARWLAAEGRISEE